MMFPLCPSCLNPTVMTYIPVKYSGYIDVSFQIVASCQFWAHIQFVGYGFIGLLAHAAFGVMIYSTYLCLVILSVNSLAMRDCY